MKNNDLTINIRNIMRAIVPLSLVIFLSSCASLPKGQSQIDAMLNSQQYPQAITMLKDNPKLYGNKNELLYLLDKGFAEHLNRDYKASIETFAKAQKQFDQLYTESVSKIAATWVINDYAAPYHGEDFEHVFINIFQALNYLMLGEYTEALVEARAVDSKLNAINFQYADDQKNVYKEDAFARMLMGIIYEIEPISENINDAFISYAKADDIYENDYVPNYSVYTPNSLKENILSTARFMGLVEYSKYKNKFKSSEFLTQKEKRAKAEVYLIQYNGFSRVKTEAAVAVPLFDGHIVKVAFPEYKKRPYAIHSSRILAKDSKENSFQASSELVQDIGAISQKNLDRRKIRFIAKSVLRATGRYLFEKKQEENIKKSQGSVAAGLFGLISNVYNLVVEQADLRCWQSLPDQIRIARLILEPGDYNFTLENFNDTGSYLSEIKLEPKTLVAGQKLFLIVRTLQ
ncbi:MAG: hypothetical protein KJ915_00130 [Candidatus Omnitrophica bacterium]|nr:hypothetical protein [Candidatus Omnitrophota bacterium]